jgi:hypothetical protein
VVSIVFLLATVPSIAQLDSIERNHGALTLDDRIRYQRAIEEVYWRYRIWPKENPGPKPPLDEVLPLSEIRAKVEDYLRKSVALEQYWQRPVTGEQLQAEMDRMARQTRKPEMLRDLWSALGNDPLVIAECLARPALVERLIRNWYSYDERFHGELKANTTLSIFCKLLILRENLLDNGDPVFVLTGRKYLKNKPTSLAFPETGPAIQISKDRIDKVVLVALGRVFITGQNSPGSLYMIDPAQPEGTVTLIQTTTPLGNNPAGLAFDGSRIWVAAGDRMSIITPGASFPWASTTVVGFNNLNGVLFDGSSIWVTDVGDNSIKKLDANGAVMQTIAVGAHPGFPTYDGINI